MEGQHAGKVDGRVALVVAEVGGERAEAGVHVAVDDVEELSLSFLHQRLPVLGALLAGDPVIYGIYNLYIVYNL